MNSICPICGSRLIKEDNFYICALCAYKNTDINASDEFRISILQANNEREVNQFDNALTLYNKIIEKNPEQSTAYWGAFLSVYGIEYIKDKESGKDIPTSHRAIKQPVYDCKYYINALKYENNPEQIALYKESGSEIESVRKKLIEEIDNIKEKYDIFICYKSKEDVGDRKVDTKEAKWAADLYSELTHVYKYKVFFAERTLPKGNEDYEPKIYSALKSSRFMIIITSSLDNLKSPWVKNEWSRFLEFMKEDGNKTFKILSEGIEAYELPPELQKKQALDQDSLNWHQDLISAINNFMGEAHIDNLTESELERHISELYGKMESEVDRFIPSKKILINFERQYNRATECLKNLKERRSAEVNEPQ